MSRQKFSASQREALWLTYEKKCAYTRTLLDVSDFHIDHIVPESLADKPVEFEKVKLELGLANDFDIFGYENLLPCRPGINQQKGARVLGPASIHYFLGLASSKKADVKAILERIEKRKNRGKALILLQQCLERGELTASDVTTIIEDHNEQPEEIFRLIEGMQFSDATEVQFVAKADIDELRTRPIRLGRNEHIDGVTLTNRARDQVHVRTCAEYDAAINAGFYALTTFDIKMSVFFKHQCGLLRLLQAATTPEYSYVAEPRVGIVDIELLPFATFPQLVHEYQEEGGTATYQSKIDDGTISVKRLRQNMLWVEGNAMGQRLVEVARADFDGDGCEDILLFEYCYATQGTLGYGNIRLLSRKTSDGLFEIVSP